MSKSEKSAYFRGGNMHFFSLFVFANNIFLVHFSIFHRNHLIKTHIFA
jgi:hypothetical protein